MGYPSANWNDFSTQKKSEGCVFPRFLQFRIDEDQTKTELATLGQEVKNLGQS